MEFFPGKPKHQHDRSSTLLFEKSANYFDASLAASRVRALLPDALLISILIDPGARAYSWYQVSVLRHRCPQLPGSISGNGSLLDFIIRIL